MKSYTDLEQSKRLAEILPVESADMYYPYILPKSDRMKHNPEIGNPVNALKWYNKGYTTFGKESITLNEYCVPCWSLAALLSVLPFHLIIDNQRYAFSMIKGLNKNGETYAIKYAIFNTTIHFHLTDFYNNPVDACYEMILKLHGLKML